jgi:hypothetical protein
MFDITARSWLLSVTESIALPPPQAGGSMPDIPQFDFRQWLVPPEMVTGLLWPADLRCRRSSTAIHL